ncbi:MAG: hypothetical protein HY565_03505 [Candidatus Kerfeldbacteria bacterium]|nr:hypothetical protein [Candidatus Kerfeldbacteria bacterium]
MDWATAIKLLHIIGTVLGVGGETLGSIFYFRALRDGNINPTESEFLRVSFQVLRVGLILLVISGFGYFLNMRFSEHTAYIFEPRLIAKLSLVVILLGNALLLHMHKIPMWIGGAISITSWYAALILGGWRGLDASLLTITLVYLAFVVVVAIGERTLRKMMHIPL